MKSGISWNLGALDENARAAASEAARQEGVSLNEWLSHAVSRRAAEQGVRSPAADTDNEVRAVTNSIARLTQRLRGMDQGARATLSGLKPRLDEIEDNLSRVTAGGRDERRSRSLRGVAAMVDQLAREVENADETARSAVEGRARYLRPEIEPAASRFAEAATPARDPNDQISQVIRTLDDRIASMAQRLKKPQATQEGAARLDDLRERLEGLLAKQTETAVRAPSATAAPQIDSTLKVLERKLDEMKARMASPTPEPSPVAWAENDERLRRLEAHLSGLNERLSTPSASLSIEDQQRFHELEGRLAEITGRLSAPTPPPPKPGMAPEDEERLHRIEERLARISNRLADPPQQSKFTLSLDDEERMHRIERQLAAISGRLAEPPPPSKSPKQTDELSAAIAEIASRQRSLADRAETSEIRRDQQMISEAMTALRSDIASLVARVTAIGRAAEEDTKEAYYQVARRIEALAADAPVDRSLLSEIHREVDAIRASVEDKDSYYQLVQRIETLAAEAPVDRGILADIRAELDSVRGTVEDKEALYQVARRIEALAAEQPINRGILAEIHRELDAVRALGAGTAREQVVLSRLDQIADLVPDRGRLDALGEELSAIRRAIESADGPRAVGRLEMRVSELARAVEVALNSRQAAIDASGVSINAGIADIRQGLEALIAENRRRAPDLTSPGAVASMAANLVDIRAALDELSNAQRSGASATPVIAGLSGSLGEIKRAIDEVRHATRLNERNDALMAGLSAGFAELRSSIEHVADLARKSDRGDTVAIGLATSLSGIRGAIDDLALANRNSDPAAAVIAGLSDALIGIRTAIDELADHNRKAAAARSAVPPEVAATLAQIKRSVEELAAAPRAETTGGPAVAGISASLADIRGAIEDLAVTSRYGGPGSASAAVASLAANLDDIRAAIDARDTSARQTDEVIIGRLEGRLDEIAARIDGVLDLAAPAEIVHGLHDRLEALVDRLDQANASSQPLVLEEIKQEISAIRRDIGAREPMRVDHIEDQIRNLAGRLEEVSRPEADAVQVANLESQVARLAADLEKAMPRSRALEQVEANLGRLQSHLADSRHASIEAARDAARDAVRELSGGGQQVDAGLLRALRTDLDQIRATAGDSDQRTQETLSSLHSTLSTIVERLSAMEGPEVRAASFGSGRNSSPVETSATRPTIGQVTDAADMGALRELSAGLNAARNRAGGNSRGDFIAAARRAAQAAVAEAGSSKETKAPDMRPSAFARIGNAIRYRKKPLLLAAAAVVLAIGALHVFGPPQAVRSAGTVTATIQPTATVASAEAPAPAPIRDVTAPTPTVPVVADNAMAPPVPDAAITLAAPGNIAGRFGESFTSWMPSSKAPAGAQADASPGEDVAVTDTASTPASDEDAAPITVSNDKSATDSVETSGPNFGSDKLRAAAAAGDPVAAFEVATRYAEGRGVPQNLGTAADWYRRAAEGGVAVAQYRLGSLYERGQGVPKDLTAAVNWYQRAADQGNVGAMHNLAVLMSEGVDGPPDSAKALEWFLAAGNYGVKDSQYNLGVIFARGIGHDRDLVESYKWFAIAAAQGDNDAASRRDEVGAMLDADQLGKARAAVAAWHAKPPLPEANGVNVPDGGWEVATEGGITEADRQGLVRKIQELLVQQGYDPGPPDGVVGPKTREAVKAFQHNKGIAETGKIDTSLVTALADQG